MLALLVSLVHQTKLQDAVLFLLLKLGMDSLSVNNIEVLQLKSLRLITAVRESALICVTIPDNN